MSSSSNHQRFTTFPRRSQTLCNDRCQNILYKAVFEHFIEIKWIAVLLVTSKSFQNSSFGANFLVNFTINSETILLLESVLSPSSCFSLQLVPSLYIQQWGHFSNTIPAKLKDSFFHFVGELFSTKYLHLSLRTLVLVTITSEVLSSFFGSSTNNSFPQLRDLSLNYCKVNDAILEKIAKNALHLRTVELSKNTEITDAGLEHLSKLSGITSLDLSWCDRITDAGLEHIGSKLSNITSLNLRGCIAITDVGLEHLSKLSGITSFNLTYCRKITDVGIEHIAKLDRITSLNLNGCSSISDAGLVHLAKLSRITSLDLTCCAITDAGLRHIADLSNMTSVRLCCCRMITDTGLQFVSKLNNITSLDLSYCDQITDAGLEHVSKLSNITSLNLERCNEITDVGVEQFCKLYNMICMSLDRCDNVNSQAKTKLLIALPNCKVDNYE